MGTIQAFLWEADFLTINDYIKILDELRYELR